MKNSELYDLGLKVCKVCSLIKPLSDFNKDYKNKYYEYQCKQCRNEKHKLYHNKHKEEHSERVKKWVECNREVKRTHNKKSINKIKSDPEVRKKLNYKSSQYLKLKRKTDINYKIQNNIRSRFYYALKKGKKYESVLKLLSCSIEEFKLYLEKQFLPEMNWDNHGVIWEMDHIKPCASFNLVDIEQQKQCFHFSNHQPLFKTTEIAESFGYKNHIGNRDKSDTYL